MTRHRSSLRFEDWPEVDRIGVEAAFKTGIGLDDDGPLAHLSAATREFNQLGYGYWLHYIATHEALVLHESPGARATPARVCNYLYSHCQGLSSTTLYARIRSLGRILGAIDPNADLRIVKQSCRLLARRAKPSRDQRAQLVAPSDLFYSGIRRMKRHAKGAASDASEALKFEDGLMMAMLAAKALRRGNFVAMTLGRNLTRARSGCYEVKFEPVETKARNRISAAMPILLTPYLDYWLDKARPTLLQARGSDAMWINANGAAMTPNRFYQRFCAATMNELGRRINPHLVRKIVATGVAIAAPELVRMTPSLLDQSSDQSAVYNLADQLSASDAYLKVLSERRRLALHQMRHKP